MTDGYSGTSLRAVARDADVDHALVNYYFSSKQRLFGEVMSLTLAPSGVLDRIEARGFSDVPEAVLATLLAVWDDPNYQAPLVSMMEETATTPQVREAVQGYLEREVFGRVANLAGSNSSKERSAGAAVIMSGVVFARYLLRIEPLVSMTTQEVVRAVAPALRTVLGLPPLRR